MTEQKLIAVVGATGSQGGALARAALADHQFAVRALTRDVESAKARELAAGGAEVVEADLDDPASLRKAFDGAHGAYVVTNYWAARTGATSDSRTRAEMEIEWARSAASAAAEAGVSHVIWSTLEDTRPHFGDGGRVPAIDDRYTVPHFDAKAEADELFVAYGVPTTFMRTAPYFEGLTGELRPVRAADGKLVLTLPMADRAMSGIAVDDIGRTALGIFKRGPDFIGRTVSIAGDHLTGAEYATALSTAIGEEVTYRPYTPDEFRALGFPLAVEMGNMFQYLTENSQQFTRDRDLRLVRRLNPQLQSFGDWLAVHKSEIRA